MSVPKLGRRQCLTIGVKFDETRLFQQYCDTVTNNNVITVLFVTILLQHVCIRVASATFVILQACCQQSVNMQCKCYLLTKLLRGMRSKKKYSTMRLAGEKKCWEEVGGFIWRIF